GAAPARWPGCDRRAARRARGHGARSSPSRRAAGDRRRVVSVRRLVVGGDDFGAAREVNAAIVRAHREGILTSTSLMVTGDAAAEAVALARENPRLAVGLHLVLAQGRPSARREEIPGLRARDGEFHRGPVTS